MRIEWWLVRHGLTEWNVQHRYQGHSDLALLPGEASGLEPLRRELARVNFSAVYVSDLLRCRQTLEYARPDLAELCMDDRRLREMDFGAWEGRTYETLKDDALYRAWIDDPQQITPPDGESWPAFCARVEAVCQELTACSQALAAEGRSRRKDDGEMPESAARTRLDAKVMRENANVMPENAEMMGETAEVLPRNSRTVRLLIVTHGGVVSLLSAMLEPGLGFWETRLPPGGIKRLYWGG